MLAQVIDVWCVVGGLSQNGCSHFGCEGVVPPLESGVSCPALVNPAAGGRRGAAAARASMPHDVKFSGPRTPQWGCSGCGAEHFRCRPTCRRCDNRAPARLRQEIAAAAKKAGGAAEGDARSKNVPESEVIRLRRRVKELEQRPPGVVGATQSVLAGEAGQPCPAGLAKSELQDLAARVTGYESAFKGL